MRSIDDDQFYCKLKAGKTTVTYTAGGISVTYDITIEASSLPSTGQDFGWVWVLIGAAAVLSLAAALTLRKRAAV